MPSQVKAGPPARLSRSSRYSAAQRLGVELTIYRGGHLDLITEAGHLAPVVEAFLTAADRASLTGTDPQAAPRRGRHVV